MSKTHYVKKQEIPSAVTSLDSIDSAGNPGVLQVDHGMRVREQLHIRQLLKTYEQYRKMAAYEIHDGVVQCMTGALIHLEASLRVLGNHVPEAAQKEFDRTLELLRNGIVEARCLMSGLQPKILDDLSLTAAVDHLVRVSRGRTRASIEWSYLGDFDRLAPPLKIALFRIIQESLTNALRYSDSNKVRIALTKGRRLVHLTVEDWGCGFEVQQVAGNRLGLQGIRERARLFGGQARINSAPGRGTCIAVSLPLVEEMHARPI